MSIILTPEQLPTEEIVKKGPYLYQRRNRSPSVVKQELIAQVYHLTQANNEL